MPKHYGLTGQTVKLRHTGGETKEYPWGYAEQEVLITEEHPYVLIARMLPHYHPQGFGLSTPYNVCINKSDITFGNIIINGGAIR